MAWSSIYTRLPLDEYARIMAIPGWLFNQVEHDGRPMRGECNDIWLQSGYYSDPNRIAGRDELAQAIATAESQLSRFLGFWFTRVWTCADEIQWPRPRRGYQVGSPIIKLSSGLFVEGGREAFELIAENQPVVYSNRDGDAVTEWATITVADAAALVGSVCEVVVVPHGVTQIDQWEIRPLNVAIDGTDIVITGWKWLFVESDQLLRIDPIMLSEDAKFIQGGVYDGGVDIYRRYNDPAQQAQIVWTTAACTGETVCTETCQSACIVPYERRTGLVRVQPSTYSAGVWSSTAYRSSAYPDVARFWYRAGYDDDTCVDCTQIGPALKEAIVRLANVHLPEAPCGCTATTQRWDRDREEMSINAIDAQMAASHFGSTARGAIFAYNVVSRIPPLGRGG